MNLREGHLRFGSLETMSERQGWGGVDMCRRGIVDTWYKGCRIWNCPTEGKEESHREVLQCRGSVWQRMMMMMIGCHEGDLLRGSLNGAAENVMSKSKVFSEKYIKKKFILCHFPPQPTDSTFLTCTAAHYTSSRTGLDPHQLFFKRSHKVNGTYRGNEGLESMTPLVFKQVRGNIRGPLSVNIRIQFGC